MLGSDRFAFETPNVIDPGDMPPSVPERKNTSEDHDHNPSPPAQVLITTPTTTPSKSGHKKKKSSRGPKKSPSCSNSFNSNTLSTHSEDSSDEDGYHESRNRRLLNDIRDLELTPSPGGGVSGYPRPYDPYHDDDEEEEEDSDEEDSEDDDYEKGTTSRGGGRRTRQGTSSSVMGKFRSSSVSASLPSPEEARMHAMLLLADRDVRKASSFHHHHEEEQVTVRLAGDVIASKRRRRYGSKRNKGLGSSGGGRANRKGTVVAFFRECCGIGNDSCCSPWKVLLVAVVVLVTVILSVTLSRRNGGTSSSGSNSSDPLDPANTGFVPENVEARTQDIVDFLTANGVTPIETLKDPSSPQSLAVHWMAAMDPVQVDIPQLLHSPQRFVQRYTLAVLFYSLDGTHWKERYEWMTAVDECAWYREVDEPSVPLDTVSMGVSCHPRTLTVQGLYLPSNGLKGSIPDEIQYLTDLELLAAPYNDISGRFPSGMAKLTLLNYLDLRYNAIEGYLPDWLGDLEALQVLGLSGNHFEGSIPPNVGTLADLKSIALSDNAFTGPLDFVNHLNAIEYLWVDGNSFTGTLTDSFLSSHSDLIQVDVGSNNLKCDGDFPVHLLEHETLEVLNADNNPLNAALPPLSYTNFDLQYLSLRNTMLRGSIPTSLPQLRVLKHLDLHGNSLTGTVPYQLGTMDSLTYLFLGDNGFEREEDFPPYLSSLVNLQELNLESMQLGGSIPNWLGTSLTDLRMVDLSHNYLRGSVPSNLWRLRQLTYVLLHDNWLTGTIPQGVQFSNQLSVVALYKNQLEGDASVFCAGKGPDAIPDLVAIDCAVTCDKSCCSGECCPGPTASSPSSNATAPRDDDGDSHCYPGKVATYMSWYADRWDFNYTKDDFAFDPAILVKMGIAESVDVEDGELVPTIDDRVS
jgi:hypothetical protein